MDNECSKTIEDYSVTKQNTKKQFVEPHQHQVNAVERAIRTFKYHFVAGLATVDMNFSMQLWNELLEQGQDSLNLLQASQTNPKLSAYAMLEGEFNYNKTPIAPPYTKALVYHNPSIRTNWSTHALDAWYIGKSKNHYWCYNL